MAQPNYKFTGNTEDFECPICTLVVSSPVQTNCCGSVYCKSCIVQWGGTTSGSGGSRRHHRTDRRRSEICCPNCRHTPLQYYDDKRTERMVKGLTVTCSNHKAGCDWTGELRNLSDHLNSSSTSSCQFQVVPCPNRCGESSILRSLLQDHIKEKCSHRKVQCVYCQLTGHYKVIVGSHYDECPRVPVQCPNNCSASGLVRFELIKHIKKCPLQVVPCEYSHAGCDKRMARKDVEIHQVTGMMEHLTLVNRKLLRLQEHIECKDHISPIVFKMSNFSQQQSWDSPCFYSHSNGYKLQLMVMVNHTESGLFDIPSTSTPSWLSSHAAVSVSVSSCASSTTKSTKGGLFNTSNCSNSTSSLSGFNLLASSGNGHATNLSTPMFGFNAASHTTNSTTSSFSFTLAPTSSGANAATNVSSLTPNATTVSSSVTVSSNTAIGKCLVTTSAGGSAGTINTANSCRNLFATSTTGNAVTSHANNSNATANLQMPAGSTGNFSTTGLMGTSASTLHVTPSFSNGATSAGHFSFGATSIGPSSFNMPTGSLSISVIVKEGPFDERLHWPMCARVNVALLNQLQDSQHHSVTFQIEKPRPGTSHVHEKSDHLHFIFCKLLNNTLSGSLVQFLKNDSLYFKATVELLGPDQPQPWLNCTLVPP